MHIVEFPERQRGLSLNMVLIEQDVNAIKLITGGEATKARPEWTARWHWQFTRWGAG